MLSSLAYCIGKSYTEVVESYREPIILYTLVGGRSGTNKSSCIALFRNMIENLPKLPDLFDKDPLFDSGTMEGLMASLIDNNESVLCAIDEFGTFLDAMDKNSNSTVEKSRYLSLYTGMSWSKKTKTSGLWKLKEPRFQLTSFYQNYHLVNMVVNANHSDGFLGRFLVATPKEEYITLKEKIQAGSNLDHEICDMQVVFNKMYEKFFKSGAVFKLDDDAIRIFEHYHDDEVLRARQNDPFDETKVSVLSKSIGQVLRIAGVQSALRSILFDMQLEKELIDVDPFEPMINTFDDIGGANISLEDLLSGLTNPLNVCPIQSNQENQSHNTNCNSSNVSGYQRSTFEINKDDMQRATVLVRR